jgi:hypothetical protein
MSNRIEWPEGKKFAFTIFDDTDSQTLVNGPPVYNLLHDLGFRTTKSVWPLRGTEQPLVGGGTCEDEGYFDWVSQLQHQGFEIGLHNATYHTSTREQTQRGLDRFRQLFGHDPCALANHTGCREALYWGHERLTGVNSGLYRLLTKFKTEGAYQGHREDSSLFWGDLCRNKIKYVRNFVFSEINTLKACPLMPYHDPLRPYVNLWFASSEGPNARTFVQTLTEENQDRLEEEGGACIMYTHFGKSFFGDGELHPRFRMLMERLSRKGGWFVPVTTLLDHLERVQGRHELTDRERTRLERKWLWHKFRVGGCS